MRKILKWEKFRGEDEGGGVEVEMERGREGGWNIGDRRRGKEVLGRI